MTTEAHPSESEARARKLWQARDLSLNYPGRNVHVYHVAGGSGTNHFIRFTQEPESEVDGIPLRHVGSFRDGAPLED